MITDHNLITRTYSAGGRVTVTITHTPSGTEATSDVCDHANTARAQARERLEALLAERDGGTAA